MLISEARAHTTRTPEEVWELWATPSRWPEWDPDVASVSFSAPFSPGAKGMLKPTHGPRLRWKLESVTVGQSFVTSSRLPGATVLFIHELLPDRGRHEVVHRIEMTGWATPILSKLLGPRVAPNLVTAVRNIAGITEEA